MPPYRLPDFNPQVYASDPWVDSVCRTVCPAYHVMVMSCDVSIDRLQVWMEITVCSRSTDASDLALDVHEDLGCPGP